MKKRTWIIVLAVVVGSAAAILSMIPDDPVPTQLHQPVALAEGEAGAVAARFWEPLNDGRARCLLCAHFCVVPPGERGICRVRENREGALYTLVYGRLATFPIAPIEKDGMYHALPGTEVLAIATAGCNFRCQQCHNWHITQRGPEDVGARWFTPQEVVDLALRAGARTITGTINEPTVFYEFLYDVAVLARQEGLRMQFHTNGAIAEEALRALLRRIDQAVVDLKGFCPATYREYYGGCLDTVLRTLRIIREEGAWLEITNLVIPTVNDCLEGIRAMSEWIVENLGPDVPLHFTRFHPAYRLTHLPATPIETLEKAHAIARETGINFVTIGNVPGHRYNSTFCPDTGERLIHRVHFTVMENKIVDGRSPFSGRPVPGVWE
ncbi:MAG TPA: AmmeMemoRadiSam system radical SAM enzyme [Atribacteraceae bacterium]|nr:AmmeMemoRadiSam system radical SAM enzyme [Atribacteraceae bacterium]